MKLIKLLALFALAIVASACRTTPVLDPMTMEPNGRCMPGTSSTAPSNK